MTKIFDRDVLEPDCPIRNILSRIGEKWTVLTIYTLSVNGTMRFKALQNGMPDISQKMLTITLRTLEEDGLVTRTIYPQVPPKVEYSLTERAYSLIPHLNTLIDWAKDHMQDIIDDRMQNKKNS